MNEALKGLLPPVAQLITILTAAVLITAWLVRLESRTETLEKQLQALVITSPDKTTSAEKSGSTLRDACVRLADRVASAYEGGSPLTVAKPLEELMASIGCTKS